MDEDTTSHDMRVDYPQISATVRHVDDAGMLVSSAYESGSTNFPGALPGAQLLGATASADTAFRDRRDLLAQRLFAFVDAVDETVTSLVLTDDEYSDLLRETLPQ